MTRAPSTVVTISSAVVGGRIRRARLERGLTQAQLARGILSPSSLSAIERERRPLSLAVLEALATRLDLSLSSLLRAAPGADEAARLMVERAADSIRAERPLECLAQLDMAVITPSLRPYALFCQGVGYSWSGNPEAGVPILREALALAEAAGDTELTLRIGHNLGNALYDLHRFDEALAYYRQAFDGTLHVLGDRRRLAMLSIDIGHVLLVKKDIDLAESYYERAREYMDSSGDFYTLASVYSGLSYVYHAKGEADQAVQYAELALAAVDRTGDEIGSANACVELATWLLEARRVDEAEATAREAIARSQAAASPEHEALAHSALASVLLHRGDLDAARAEAEIAAALALDKETDGRFDAWTVLAEIADREGNHGEADALYTRALEGFKRVGMFTRYSEVAIAYGQLLMNRGETDRAMQYALLASEVPGRDAEGRPSPT